ncbi:MAG TPA: type II toxin-antitoxin system VapC family toxin [Rhizomicrobium sp.]|nr:type II toxin-antitoxin system VapC family toxin [Rhizomicrobium sp.]
MVIDSSALFAIVFDEPDHPAYLEAIITAVSLTISAPTLFECRMVALRKSGPDLEERILSLLKKSQVSVAAFDEHHVELAMQAFHRYGKGRHAAGLNFGDCFAYALAKSLNEPLLYKGADFARTDIVSAI